MQEQKPNGFALIAIILAIVLLLAIFAYVLKPGGEKESVVKTGRNAEDQLNQSNNKMKVYQGQLNQNIDLQNDVNSIGQ